MKKIKILFSVLMCVAMLFTANVTVFAETGDIDEVICIPSGDLNADESYSTEDVKLALKIADKQIEPTDEQLENGDIDRDGYITTSDASQILKIVSGMENLPEHMYSQWAVSVAPTCTVNGIEKCQCIICYATFRKILPATGHNYEDDICTVCGEINSIKTIIYNRKKIPFGACASDVEAALGVPTEALIDNNTTVYVYASDYSQLGIFTFIDNSLTQFYSNSFSSGIIYAEDTFYLSNIYDYSYNTVYEKLGTIDITGYVDTKNEIGAYAYAFLATVGEKYDFQSTSNYIVQEKINFHLLNGCRAIYNLAPLKYSTGAANVARKHSADMGANNYFDHTGLNGSSPGDRLEAGGVNWRMYGENIAAGITDPYHANNGWYNSPEHRVNMLKTGYTYVGVGIAHNKSSIHKYYATQNFYTN